MEILSDPTPDMLAMPGSTTGPSVCAGTAAQTRHLLGNALATEWF